MSSRASTTKRALGRANRRAPAGRRSRRPPPARTSRARRPARPGSQLGAGETVTSRASTGANVARNRVTSAEEIRASESRSTISAERSSSPRIPRATARLAPASASAARYADRAAAEPCRDDSSLHRERVGRRDARALALDRARDERRQRELAITRHPRERGDAGRRQRRRPVHAPHARRQVRAAPSSRPRRARRRGSRGASHRLASRAHSQTHAAYVLSGSFERSLRCAQPHDQTCASSQLLRHLLRPRACATSRR